MKLVGPFVSVHRLVLFYSDVYRFLGPLSARSAATDAACFTEVDNNCSNLMNLCDLSRVEF